MSDGVLQRLPDVGPLLERRATAEGQLESLLGAFAALEPANPNSPLAPVGSVLAGLGTKLDIDVSDLSEGLPAAIDVIQNALPPSALEYVEAIEDAYDSARSFLRDNPLAREVAAGASLQEVALAVIQEALNQFDQRIGELSDGLIDSDTLDEIRGVFARIEDFRSDFPGHRDEFLPFLTNHLLGVRPDLLRTPLEHLDASYAVLAPLEEETLSQTLDPAREALADAFDQLVVALEGFDPEETTAYTELELRLGELETAITSTVAAVSPVYQELQALVESHAWDDIFSRYRTLLQGITFDQPFTVDTVVDEMAEVLEEILARFHMTFGAGDLAERIEALGSSIRDAFATSALGQVRQTVRTFLEDVRETIEGVPTEEIQQAVESMMERVGQELDALGITQIKEGITGALDEAQSFVIENVNSTLTNDVRGALELVLANVQSLGLDALISELSAAVEHLDELMAELEDALNARMQDLSDLASQLETLSFEPLSDRVIEEIDQLRARLGEIDPNSLSDAERFALRGALALLEQIDLEDQIISGLKQGYRAAESQVKQLLGEITAALEQLRGAFGSLDPGQVLGPVDDWLKRAEAGTESLNARTLLQPLQKQVDRFVEELEKFSPGALLDPLQAPYDSMMQVVHRLDPAQWTAPLEALYEQIEGLIDFVDVTPLLDELDRMQRELFDNIRTTILDAFDNLALPEPLGSFFAGIRPVLEDVTGAVFGDPDTELRRIGTEVNTQISLSRLSEPLDAAFDELIGMVGSLPPEDLTRTVNTIRESLGIGLDLLDPDAVIGHLRNGHARLLQLDPRLLLGAPLRLPGLKLAFEARAEVAPPERQDDVVSVSARFDAVFSLVATRDDSSLIQPLIEGHDALAGALHRRIDALDASGASEAYLALRESLDHILPPFLRSPVPLTHAGIMTGLRAMRPSVKFDRVEEVLEEFLQQVRPLQEALNPAIDSLFGGIREVLMLVNPLELKDAVEDIYDAIREKVRVLDPDALADSIREQFFDPITGALEDINPATIKAEIDESYQETLAAISTTVKGVLDDIAGALDEQLEAIREEVRQLLDQVRATIESAAGRVKDVANRLEQLLFVDLLERLERVIDNLGLSFDKELERVRNAFDEMLAAIPLGTSGAAGGGGVAV